MRTVRKMSDNSVISTETFTYDAAGNITDAPDSCFQYDTNNRLVVFNGNTVSYDLDGNMLSNGEQCFTYDAANRLVSADGHTYTYNAEDVRIRNLCECCEDTTYTYDTNCKLSKLLSKTTNGVTTKYVYGKGLIGEEAGNTFKTYHFDCRGSTIAITDATGNITDTFAYDTYGKLLSRTGTSEIIFGYNGRDGVVTDENGLIYMRARYYSPEMKRFINADIIPGKLSNAITLNRFAYANGNPVSLVDPFGLSPERGAVVYKGEEFPIYVPDDRLLTNSDTSTSWKTIAEITESKFSFDGLQFIAGIQFDDVNGLANGTNMAPINNRQQALAGAAGIFGGLLTAVANSCNTTFITFVFQESGDQKRVIIKVGSNKVQQLYNTYATDIPNSVYFYFSGTPFAQGVVSNSVKDLYEENTGNKAKWYDTYDVEFTVDKRHKGSKYASYLWINNDGTIMEKPIVYSNDKIELGRRSGFLGLGFTPFMSMPIDNSIPVSEEYQNIFNVALKKFDL